MSLLRGYLLQIPYFLIVIDFFMLRVLVIQQLAYHIPLNDYLIKADYLFYWVLFWKLQEDKVSFCNVSWKISTQK